MTTPVDLGALEKMLGEGMPQGPLAVLMGVCKHDHPNTSADVVAVSGEFVANCGCTSLARPRAATIVALHNAAPELLRLARNGAAAEAAIASKNGAYAERNQCVALLVRMALALGWRAGVRDHEDKPGEEWDPDWRNLVCIDLPAGQVSWHFHDSLR